MTVPAFIARESRLPTCGGGGGASGTSIAINTEAACTAFGSAYVAPRLRLQNLTFKSTAARETQRWLTRRISSLFPASRHALACLHRGHQGSSQLFAWVLLSTTGSSTSTSSSSSVL